MLYDPNRELHRPWSQIYEQAADVIQERGLAKFLLEDKRGRVCLWGAINVALCGDAMNNCYHSYYSSKVLERLREFTGGYSPVTWNNRPSRRKADVIKLLRRAAKTLREEEEQSWGKFMDSATLEMQF